MTTRTIVAVLLGLVCSIGVYCHGNSSSKPLKVRAIYPAGEEVATSDRITIEFNQNMVSLGASMFLEDVVPIDIEPAVECEWNWVKLNTLQCELPVDNNLNGSTKYTVTIRPGIKAPNGQEMAESLVHSFETIVPSITLAGLVSWKSSTQPIVQVSFNQSVNLESLQDRLFLYDTSSGKEIPIKICPSDWRLSSTLRKDYFGRERTYQRFDHSDCDITGVNGSEVLVLPVEQLSPKSKVSVILLPGVEGARGNLTSPERVLVDTEIWTFDDFRLLGLACQDTQGKDVLIPAGKSVDVVCRLRTNFTLVFSSRLGQSDINDFVHTEPQTKRQDQWKYYGTRRPWTIGKFLYRIGRTFEPSATYRLVVAPSSERSDETTSVASVLDGFERPLVGPDEITFRTGHAYPDTFVDPTNIVVDSNGSFDPVFFLRNVEDVAINYDLLDEDGISQRQIQSVLTSNEEDVWHTQSLGLRTALRSPSGVMYGKIISRPRFDRQDKQISDYFFAQATPYSVFLKLGTVNSLAWVVDLQTGEPIADAEVDFYTGTPNDFADIRNSIFSGLTNKDGLVVLPGYESFDPHWDKTDDEMMRDCARESDCTLYFLRVRGEAGLALLPLDEDYVLAGQVGSIYENVDHWATTSQNLYMPGDTVRIKGYVRISRDEIRIIPKEGNFALCAYGPDDREYEIGTISLNRFGAYQASLKLNERTEFGTYQIVLIYDPERPITDACSHSYDGRGRKTLGIYVASGGSFKVHEFKTNPIRVSLDLDKDEFERGDSMSMYTSAIFHAGGPYANADGQVVVNLWADTPPFESIETRDYVISRNPEAEFNRHVLDINLNDDGKNTAVIEMLDSDIYYGNFEIESSIISDRGKSVATQTTATYYGVDEFVGIRRPTIYPSYSGYSRRIKLNEPWPIQVMVLSKDDEVVEGKKVQISVLARDTNREYQQYKWLEKVFQCEVTSASSPVACEFTPPLPISYVIQAQITDTKGNTHRSSMIVTAIDAEPRSTIVDRRAELELICDSQHVDVGQLVNCDVNNYQGSGPLLVTLERAGVVDQWLVQPDTKNPTIEFHVRDNYAPHFELSVLSASPRSLTHIRDEPKYEIASAQFTMENPRQIPLEIEVSTNRESYSPGNRVTLSISTEQHNIRDVPIEYAIAVVDEALVDLSGIGDDYFDPTKKSWKFSDHGLQTFGLITSLIEQATEPPTSQEYSEFYDMEMIMSTGTRMPLSDPPVLTIDKEQKSDSNVRMLDRFVAYWNPSVVVSKKRTKLDFRLPDNLTSWKVLVLAVSADDRFGFATTTFSSVKDTEIRAVAPNVVTEGDTFQVGASILNRADRQRRLTVELDATGSLGDNIKTKYERQLDFEPFERKVVTLDIEAGKLPLSLDGLHSNKTFEIQVVARAGDRRDNDGLDIRIPVRSNKVRVSSVVYGALDGEITTIPIGIPNKVADENGHLDFTLTTNKAINFDGVFRYAIEYPYGCWEQKLTRAILAMQYEQLEKRGTKHGIHWSDPHGLIANVLASAVDFQTFDGGMTYFVSRYENADPYLSAYTAIAFTWLAEVGYEVPQDVTQKLMSYLHDFLENERQVITNAADRDDKTLLNHLQATVRAVVVHALAVSGELTETELIQYSDQINQMDLFGLSQYLMASVKLDPSHPLNGKILERIMNHRSLVDGAVEFVETVPRGFTRILHSDTRSLCSVLEALTKVSETSAIDVDVGELNELSNSVRYARDNAPYWSNTQDNVFCTNAMIKFFDYVDSDTGDLLATVDLRSDETGLSTRLAEGWQFDSKITQLTTKYSLQSQLFGSNGAIEISRQGNGIAFYDVQLSYLTTIDERINRFSGFEVHREYVALRDKKWQILKPGDHINKGEYVLVNLYLNNRFDRHHVVIDDSVPGGLEPVNKSLGTEYTPPFDQSYCMAILSTSKLFREFKEASFWSFRHRELGLQSVRYFANSIRRGKHHLSWLGQAISTGEFTVLPTHVEEMYRPIMFGKSEPWTLIVKDRSQSSVE